MPPGMKIEAAWPPMIADIERVFGARPRRTIFCVGSTIFNPDGITVGRELLAHEAVHSARQGDSVDAWWRRYLDDPAFRLAEELPAHRAEYAAYCETHADRNRRARYLHACVSRLAGPLYGRLLTAAQARREMQG